MGKKAAIARGAELHQTSLSPLSPMASHTVAVKDFVSAQLLEQLATILVLSDRGILGLQTVDPPDGDLVGLPALTTTSQGWFFPIVTTGGAVELWTAVGLFNPGKVSTAVTVEAFDAQNTSLGIIASTTLWPGTSHEVTTANLDGIIPLQAAVLKVTSDEPITGYAVIGAIAGIGLTATLGIPAEDQTRVGFELMGSTDGGMLAVSPLVRVADGSVRSTGGQTGKNDTVWAREAVVRGYNTIDVVKRQQGQADEFRKVDRAVPMAAGLLAVSGFQAGQSQRFAYVTNPDPGSVSVLDTATNTVVATVPVGRGPL